MAGILLGLVAAACGGGNVASGTSTTSTPAEIAASAEEPPATAPSSGPAGTPTTASFGAVTIGPADTGEPQTTTAPPASTAPATTSRARPEGDDAPDFSLILGQGGTFTLSEEQKPVYMVFWAEW